MFVQRCRVAANGEAMSPVGAQRVVVIGGGRAAAGAKKELRGTGLDVSMLREAISGIDLARRHVLAGDAPPVPYDSLVLATGLRFAYVGEDRWEEFAGDEGGSIAARMRLAGEFAESDPDPAERTRLLTFLVVGRGPAGVQVARALAAQVPRMLAPELRDAARVVLLTPDPALPSDAPQGIEVRLGVTPSAISADQVQVGAERIADGILPEEAGAWLGAPLDAQGRLPVTDRLTVAGCGGVYTMEGGVAEAGLYVARAIRLALDPRAPTAPRKRRFPGLFWRPSPSPS
jgi:NADH dehydrogenase FAD-containing subunit